MNCKPGDLALIVFMQHQNNQSLVGQLCTVLRQPVDGESLPDTPHIGTVRGGPLSWLIKLQAPWQRRGTKGTLYTSIYAQAFDTSLLPIRPEADPLEVRREATADV